MQDEAREIEDSYMNYDFGMDRDMAYLLLVEVDETGRLTISAADARQMKTIINKHSQSGGG